MRGMIVGIAAMLAVSIAVPAWAEDMTEEIQEEEQPGSEIEIDMGGGKAQVERKSGAPLFGTGAGEQLIAPNDPDMPEAGDPIDDALPGEGPEDLSGPDDDDNLPD